MIFIIGEVGQPARRITETEINTVLKDVRLVIVQASGNRDEIAEKIAQTIKRYDFVAEVMTPKQLLGKAKTSDLFLTLHRNSYSSERVPRYPLFDFSNGTSPIGESGVVVRLTKGTIIDLDRAVHGSAYQYDRNVPLIFMGTGVTAGTSAKPAYTIDVAPTLATLAGVSFPVNLDGKPLLKPRK